MTEPMDLAPRPLDPASDPSAELADLQRQLQALTRRCTRAEKRIATLEHALGQAREATRGLRRSLEFQLGRTLAHHGATPLGWLKLPLAIHRVLARHRQQPAPTAALQPGVSPPIVTPPLPPPEPHAALLAANRAVDDSDWLQRVNAYLADQGLAPLELTPGDAPRFFRLACRCNEQVADGPLVSVIMPAYNAERTLELAVRSILAQSWRALELIIVDDASDDATWAIAQRLAAADPRVRPLRMPANVGPYVCKNLALRAATGRFITGHDADDWAHPQRLQLQVQALQRPGSGACVLQMLRLDEHGRFTQLGRPSSLSRDGALRIAFISCLFEAGFLRQCLGGWDTVRFAGDSEIIARAKQLLGAGFHELPSFGLLCLDMDGSLSRDPVHGIHTTDGLSLARQDYKRNWGHWHQALDPGCAQLPFPHRGERFAIPQAMAVDPVALDKVLAP